MIKKIFSFYLLLLSIHFLIISCGRKVQTCQFEIDKITIEAQPIDYLSSNSTSIIGFDSLYLRNIFGGNSFSCAFQQNANFLIQGAYAWSFPPNNIKVVDTITSYSIKTLRNYNANYLAGSDISNIIKHKTDSQSDLTSSQLLANLNNSWKQVEPDGYAMLSFESKLKEKPANSGDTVELEITVGFANGKSFTDTTQKFVVMF